MARTIGWFLRWNPSTESPESDAELLRRFAFDKEPGTLESLMHRHGGLVLGTCERILRDTQLAEDAFQATFLVLAKRAGTVRGLLPAWLHKVAQRLCWRMIRKHRATVTHAERASTNTSDYEQQELLAVLDGEIARLPAKHRSVIQLCYLQDRTAETAGQLLGIPRGTVLSRLDSARRKLQAAFARRGITSIAILTIPTLAVSVGPALAATAAGVARGLASPSASAAVSMALTELTIMKLRTWIIAGLLAIGILGVGGTVLVMQKAAAGDTAKKPEEKPDEQKTKLHSQLEVLTKQKNNVDRLLIQAKRIQSAEALHIQKEGMSERTLRAAIEKEEEKMLDDELDIKAKKARYETAKKDRKKEADIVIDYKAEPVCFNNAVMNLLALSKTKDWPKEYDAGDLSEFVLRTGKQKPVLTRNTEESMISQLTTKFKPLLIKEYLKQEAEAVEDSEAILKAAEFSSATNKARRDELLERLDRVLRAGKDTLSDDDAEIYRETRKAMLRKMQQLELELAGVKLP